jgi:hypothetical protein
VLASSSRGTEGGQWLLMVVRGYLGGVLSASCSMQGMDRVRSGQASAWPLSADRSYARLTLRFLCCRMTSRKGRRIADRSLLYLEF